MALPACKSVLVGPQRRLVEAILRQVYDWQQWLGRGALDPRVMAAIAATPRRLFLPDHLRHLADRDHAVAIECGQLASAPSMVAVMTDLLRLQPRHRILEIGTGSGYQTAVLSRLAGAVYSVERHEELAAGAIARLRMLGRTNVAVRIGDGAEGWAGHGPFDRILLTAAPDVVPEPLLEQLRPGGVLVAPVGHPGRQLLTVVVKDLHAAIVERPVMPVRFLPMIGASAVPSGYPSELIVPRRAAG